MTGRNDAGLVRASGPIRQVIQQLLEKCVQVGGEPPSREVLIRMRDQMGIQIPSELWPIVGPTNKEGSD